MQGGGGGEVLTLQLGPSSGFVGSHFWNIQDELQQVDGYQADSSTCDRQVTDLAEEEYGDGPPAVERELRPEMFYRVGRQSVAPRLVAVDLKHGARSLKPTPSLLNSSPSSIFALKDDELVDQVRGVWGGEVEVHREPEAEKNSFMQWLEDSANQVGAVATGAPPPLYPSDAYQAQNNVIEETEEEVDMYATHQVKDGEVHSWSDFLKAQLNPKSLQLLHGDGDLDFSTYISGHELMDHGSQALEEIMDSVRYFMEECDRLQGIHAISDVNSGFGAIAQSVIQAVRDETRSAVILGMGVTDPMRQDLSSQEKSSYLARRGINEAIAMQSMTEHCSLYVPMPLYALKSAGNNPYFSPGAFKPHSLFHTSALAGVGLDTFSLTYRRKTPTFGYNSACNMSELVARLSLRSDIKLARLSLDMPFPFPNLSSRELGTMFEQRVKSQEAEARQLSIQFGSRSNLLRPTLERTQFPLFGTSLTLRGVESSSTSEYEKVLLDYGSSLSLPSGMLACSVKAPLPVTLAFPDILNGKILGSKGEIAVAKSRPKNKEATSSEDALAPPPLSIPVLCRLETTSQSGVDVWEAHEAVSKASLIHKFDYSKGVGGLDSEDFEDIERNLSVLREVYCSELEQVEVD